MAAVSQIDLLVRAELLVVRHIHFLVGLAMLTIGVIVLLIDGDD